MTYTVRAPLYSDKEWVVGHLAFQTLENDLKRPELYNEEQLNTIFNTCFTKGKGWVVEKDGKPVGVLGGILHGHIFNPEVPCFTVVFWFIEEEYRGSRAAWLLLKKLIEFKEFEEVEVALAVQTYSLNHDTLLKRLGFVEGERTFRLR